MNLSLGLKGLKAMEKLTSRKEGCGGVMHTFSKSIPLSAPHSPQREARSSRVFCASSLAEAKLASRVGTKPTRFFLWVRSLCGWCEECGGG